MQGLNYAYLNVYAQLGKSYCTPISSEHFKRDISHF